MGAVTRLWEYSLYPQQLIGLGYEAFRTEMSSMITHSCALKTGFQQSMADRGSEAFSVGIQLLSTPFIIIIQHGIM